MYNTVVQSTIVIISTHRHFKQILHWNHKFSFILFLMLNAHIYICHATPTKF